MKIRFGFVSNSSSSSFVIRGIKVTIDQIKKVCKIDDELDDPYELTQLFNKYTEKKKIDLTIAIDSSYELDGAEAVIGKDFGSFEPSNFFCVEDVLAKADVDDKAVMAALNKLEVYKEVPTQPSLKTYILYMEDNS